MDIKHDELCFEVRRWANGINQEYVAKEIAKAYFELGLSGLRIHSLNCPGSDHNNMQNIFRWLDSETEHAKQKIKILTPAILKALPAEARYRLQASDSIAYLAACAIKKSSEAASAALLGSHELIRKANDAIASLHALTRRGITQ